MDEASQKDTIEALSDWSKWLIGIGFTAGAGCVVIFREAAVGPARLFLILAICAFALSVLISMFLRHALALTIERLPLADAGRERKSVYDHPAGGWLSIGHLARAQLGTIVLGVLFFLAWVVLLPPS